MSRCCCAVMRCCCHACSTFKRSVSLSCPMVGNVTVAAVLAGFVDAFTPPLPVLLAAVLSAGTAPASSADTPALTKSPGVNPAVFNSCVEKPACFNSAAEIPALRNALAENPAFFKSAAVNPAVRNSDAVNPPARNAANPQPRLRNTTADTPALRALRMASALHNPLLGTPRVLVNGGKLRAAATAA